MRRRELLGGLAGGLAAVAGCLGEADRPTTTDDTPGARGTDPTTTVADTTTTTTAADTTTVTDTTTAMVFSRPIDLELSRRYGERPPEPGTRIDAGLTAADGYDLVAFGDDYYRPTIAAAEGGVVCAAVPTTSEVVAATATPLVLADFPEEKRPPSVGTLPRPVQSLVADVLAARDDSLTVASRIDDEQLTTPTHRPGVSELFGSDRQFRYLVVDGRVYRFSHRFVTSPACARPDLGPILEFAPAETGPGPDDTVLETAPIPADAAALLDRLLSEWVVTVGAVPPAIRTLVGRPLRAPRVAITARPAGDGTRLAAIDYSPR